MRLVCKVNDVEKIEKLKHSSHTWIKLFNFRNDDDATFDKKSAEEDVKDSDCNDEVCEDNLDNISDLTSTGLRSWSPDRASLTQLHVEIWLQQSSKLQ